jgi:NAD(P)-dependent dehydrogenase (short-subunit alcohol dehydrogenase family)
MEFLTRCCGLQASQSPAHLIIAGRNESKVRESIDALQTEFPDVDYRPLGLDLSSQKAVRNSAAEVLSWSDVPTIDIVVNSAGVAFLPERVLSEDGLEMHFAINHIGHFLFTCLIMPKLIKAAEDSQTKGMTRIVNVTSLSPTWAHMRWSDINFDKKNKDLPEDEQPPYRIHRAWGAAGDLGEQGYLPLEGYNQSKVANVLFSIGATKRLYDTHGILSLAVHPGVISTQLGRNMAPDTANAVKAMLKGNDRFYRTLGAGSATSIVAALDPKLGPGEMRDGKENYGVYLADCQISEKANASSLSSDGAERLWELSQVLVKEKFSW